MPEAVLAASFRPVRNSVVLAASYPRPRAGEDVLDLQASYTPYATLSGRQVLERLLGARPAKPAALPHVAMRRAVTDARRARWQRELLAATGRLPRGGAQVYPLFPVERPIDRAGVAMGGWPLARPIDRPAIERLPLLPAKRPIERGGVDAGRLRALTRPEERNARAEAVAPQAERVIVRDGWIDEATRRGVRPTHRAGLRQERRSPLPRDSILHPAEVIDDRLVPIHGPDRIGSVVMGTMADHRDLGRSSTIAWVLRLDHDPGKPGHTVDDAWLVVPDRPRAGRVEWRMVHFSYPVHDALVVRSVPLLVRDLVPRPGVAQDQVRFAVRPPLLGTVLPVPPGAGTRIDVVHGATLLQLAATGLRVPTVHPAAMFRGVLAGRRFPTEHFAVVPRHVPPGVRTPTVHAALSVSGVVPVSIVERWLPAVAVRRVSWVPVDRWLEATVAVDRQLLLRVDPRDVLVAVRLLPVSGDAKAAWVVEGVDLVDKTHKPALKDVRTELVLPTPQQATLLGLEVIEKAPHEAIVAEQDALAWKAPRDALLLEDARLDWGNYAPYFPWPEDNTRPYDPPQEPWPDTEPVEDPEDPPPNPIADPITGEPTYPAPGADPATGDPAVLPPRDPVQVPGERTEDFDVEVEEGILLNFITRFWDIWNTYRVYYAHITALEAINHLFGLLAAWLNDNAYDPRYWAIYWTVRDCARAAVLEFCPTYLRREWREYHEDHQDLDRDPPPVGTWRDDPVNPWRIINGVDVTGQFWAVLRSAPGLAAGEDSWVELEVETFHDDAVVWFDRAVSGVGSGGLETQEVITYTEDFQDETAEGFTVYGAGWSVLVTPTGNALKSDNTVAGDVAGAELIVNMQGTGYVLFDYAVWANRLRVYVDGEPVLDTGAADWVADFRIDLPAGTHVLTWEVTDIGEVGSDDRRYAEIDDIRVVERQPVSGPPVIDSYLEFYVNGVLRATWYGETPWNPPGAPATFQLGAGRHLLMWRFVRGQSNPGEDERGLIDDIHITHVALARAWTETICQPNSGGQAVQRAWECLMQLWRERHRLKRLRRRWLVT